MAPLRVFVTVVLLACVATAQTIKSSTNTTATTPKKPITALAALEDKNLAAFSSLAYISGIRPYLNSTKTRATILVPTNAAINKLAAAFNQTLEELTAPHNQLLVDRIVGYHVIVEGGDISTNKMYTGDKLVTAGGGVLTVLAGGSPAPVHAAGHANASVNAAARPAAKVSRNHSTAAGPSGRASGASKPSAAAAEPVLPVLARKLLRVLLQSTWAPAPRMVETAELVSKTGAVVSGPATGNGTKKAANATTAAVKKAPNGTAAASSKGKKAGKNGTASAAPKGQKPPTFDGTGAAPAPKSGRKGANGTGDAPAPAPASKGAQDVLTTDEDQSPSEDAEQKPAAASTPAAAAAPAAASNGTAKPTGEKASEGAEGSPTEPASSSTTASAAPAAQGPLGFYFPADTPAEGASADAPAAEPAAEANSTTPAAAVAPAVAPAGTSPAGIVFVGAQNNATVITPNIQAGKVTIHIIDSVLLPHNVFASIKDALDYNRDKSKAVAALIAKDPKFSEVIADPTTNITLLIPTNKAIDDLISNPMIEAVLSDPENLNKVLSYHAIKGAHVLPSYKGNTAESYPTLLTGQNVTVTKVIVTPKSDTGDGVAEVQVLGAGEGSRPATIKKHNIIAGASFIDVIDGVLVPKYN